MTLTYGISRRALLALRSWTVEDLFFQFCIDISYGIVTMHNTVEIGRPHL